MESAKMAAARKQLAAIVVKRKIIARAFDNEPIIRYIRHYEKRAADIKPSRQINLVVNFSNEYKKNQQISIDLR